MRNSPIRLIVRCLTPWTNLKTTLSSLLVFLLVDGSNAVGQNLALDEYDGVIDNPIVSTNRGPVKGIRGALTRRFFGIPYAAPPMGNLRWRPPEGVSPWTTERAALNYGHRCPQVPSRSDDSEDCLYLNVFAPATPKPGGYPVMFYIHGGGFLSGDILDMGLGLLMNGAYLAAYHDVVVVTSNYRLGALGFLTHDSLAAESSLGVSGNYGLLDMIAALKWVQTNINNFGGDRTKVMIFGHSAGASATCALLVSPLAKDLFSSAAIQSGWCGAALMKERLTADNKVVAKLGCDLPTHAATATCLRGLAPADILREVGPFSRDYYIFAPWKTSHTLAAGPTVDQKHVLPDEPLKILQQGRHNKVPLIVGTTQDEFQFFINDLSRITRCQDHEDYIKRQFEADADKVMHKYPCNFYWEARDASVQAAGDFYLTCPSRRAAQAAAASQQEPVYQYLFSHQHNSLTLHRASHLADIPYVFGTYIESLTPPALWGDQIRQYWTTFAKTGNPNKSGLARWSKYDQMKDNFLDFGDWTISERRDLKNGRCMFWDTWSTPF
jgi:para-nitrobenzyl esterase